MSDLAEYRKHCRRMTTAKHRPDCLIPTGPWTKPKPTPGCTGCVTDADRALWKQLADEAERLYDPPPAEQGATP